MLTDDDLTASLRTAFDHTVNGLAPRPGLAGTVRRARHRQRMGAAAAVTAPAIAAGALGTAFWHDANRPAPRSVAGPRPTVSTDAHASTLTLDGYRITLTAGVHATDAGYTVDKDCLVRADPAGPSVLVPGGACPLHIVAVVTTPPAGAAVLTFVRAPGGSSVSITHSTSADGNPIYLPTKLPDGSAVYVELAPEQQYVLNINQLEELANGLKVAPVADNSNPDGKPAG